VKPKRRKSGGRQRGTPNRLTVEVREAFRFLVEANTDRLQGWLDAAARKDPAKALSIVAQLAEFITPKLLRSELKISPPAAPAAPGRLSDDPVLAAQEYLSFMNGVPYVPRAATPASPPTAPTPAALAGPAAISDVPMVIRPPEMAVPAASQELDVPAAPRASTKPRAGESVVDAAPHVENGATIWAVDPEPGYPLAIPAGMVPLAPENLK
jgi:hypothetical protein